VVFGGLFILLLLRIPEGLAYGVRRPWTSHLPPLVSRISLRLIGLPLAITGKPMTAQGGLVANHSSWLDIFVLSAADRFYFVSKSEVASWALIGWLARATGTVFIQRDRKDTRRQQAIFNERLSLGHRLLFFPEGTSTDGKRVLPFKSTLFEPFLTKGHRADLMIQPITVIYDPPGGEDTRFYGWWGDMSFAPHLLKVLAARRHGSVRVILHPPISVDSVDGRKELTAQCERLVSAAHPHAKI
jgi:1-acyl-sn-glycerol-3-phosphate acyltransferase